jgi:putative ABC transport system substrate-binding protein
MKMKNALWLCAALIVMAGCGGPQKQATTNEPTPTDKVHKIGFFQYTSTTSLDDLREGFKEGLKDEGFEEGKNLQVDWKNAQGDTSSLGVIVQSFVSNDVELIGLCSTQALQAVLSQGDGKRPVVFCGVIDPAAAGAVDRNGKVKGEITGVSNPFPIAEGVALVRKLMPDAVILGTLYDPSEAFSETQLAQFNKACEDNQFVPATVSVSSATEIAPGIQSLSAKGTKAILQLPSNTMSAGIEGLTEAAKGFKIPVFSLQPDMIRKGVVAAVGVDLRAAGRSAGRKAGQILKGKKAADFPIEAEPSRTRGGDAGVASQYGITLPVDFSQ